MRANPLSESDLLQLALDGDSEATGRLLDRYRPRLLRMVAMRMDLRLRGRVDPDDVVQETFVEITERIDAYRARPDLSFFVWVRFLCAQKLTWLHRRNFGVAARDVRLEQGPTSPAGPEASSIHLVALALDGGPSPSQALRREEERLGLMQALDDMDPCDREVLVLRHFEHLSTVEAAQVLGLTESGARRRYGRALAKLHTRMTSLAG